MAKPRLVSLARRFAYRAALLAGIAILAIAGASWWLINQEHAASLRSLQKKDAELQATTVSSHLGEIAGRISELANNGLIVNALIDSASRDVYLIPFLNGIQRVHGIPMDILFADFEGREIARNGNVSFSEQELNWLREKLPAGQPASRVQLGEKGEELLAVEFIAFLRSKAVEGALLYRIKLNDLSLQKGVRLVRGKEAEQLLHSPTAMAAALNVPPIYKHFDFAVLTSSDPTARSVDWQAHGVFFILAVGMVVMVIMLGLHFGKRLTRDLRALEFFTRGVAEKGFDAGRAEAADSLEVASLAQSINGMLDHLEKAGEELRQSNEEMEEKNQLLADQKVEVEYKNREIEAAKLMLEDKAEQLALTSKYKSEFLSSMSHELRTPLNSLLILAQLLAENAEHNLSEQQIEYAKTIQGAGKDLLALISDILDLSKIESGTVTLELEDLSFANVREQLERAFRHVAQSRGLGFGVELALGLPPSLTTDSQRLQQVLKNLLSNAFKFTERGQVSVRIAAVESGWSVAHDGLNRAQAVLGFHVTDTGIGLPADKQKIIFEAFHQADTGTARKYGGTGLGLSISRELAWLLGGELRLAMSSPGKGSTFVLYLPLRAPESAAKVPPQGSMPQETIPQETNSGPSAVADDRAAIKPGERTLLIIEDDARFAGILLRAARDKGFKGIVAARGDAGLELAGEFKPTAITLDLHLPDMDGWVVLERLKRNPDTRHIPVEIISVEDNRPRGLRYGAFEYLVKPVTAESLRKALTDVNKFAEREVKDLLVAVGDEQHRNNVLDLIGSGDVRIKAVASGKDALAALKKKRYDCIVLDLKLPDIPVADLLEAIQGLDLTRDVPVIVYGIDELPQQEQGRLKSLALKGIVKEVRTPERLLDETALFLHRVVSKLPEERRKMLDKLYLSADSLAGKKVLVVDDDMRNIFALTAVLERHKMAVLSAENGRDAIDALGKNPDVDIVLMDIMMPEMDGYEAMRQIRQMKQFESLPMIALTAKAMKGDREKCIEAGASDYVSKPVDTDQLLSLLRVWLYR